MKALLLVGWDNTIGSVVHLKYPNTFKVDDNDITKYLLSIQTIASSSIIQLRDENSAALVYGIQKNPNSNEPPIYDFLLLMLENTEFTEIDYFQTLMKTHGLDILLNKAVKQKLLFDKFAEMIFFPHIEKIVFIGLPNSGKTTTKKYIYEHINEKELLLQSIEPTIGFETTTIKYMDKIVNLFDTSGQELQDWFLENQFILHESDLIIFFFSITDWQNNNTAIISYLNSLSKYQIQNNLNPNNIFIFCHKMDLFIGNINELKNKIEEKIKNFNFKIYFTSIKSGFNEDFYSALQIIINKNSQLIEFCLKQFEPLISEKILIPVFVLDRYQKIIAQYQPENKEKLNYRDLIESCKSQLSFSIRSGIIPEYQIISFNSKIINYLIIFLYPKFKDLGIICLKFEDISKLIQITENIHEFNVKYKIGNQIKQSSNQIE